MISSKNSATFWDHALALPVRRSDDEPVEFRRDLDLTAKPRIRLNLISKIQHIFFLVGRFARQRHPFFVDINMARRAGTAAAAFGSDLGDTITDGGFHDRGVFLRLDGPGFAKGVDISDFDHGSCMSPSPRGKRRPLVTSLRA